MATPERLANLIHLLEDQPAESAHAYHRDLPDAPLYLLGGGHWLLETHPRRSRAVSGGLPEPNVRLFNTKTRENGRKQACTREKRCGAT
jgi:hypothetical protein